MQRPGGSSITNISDLKEGGEDLIYQVYRRYRPDFIAWAKNQFDLNEEDAKDIYQDVVLVLWNNIQSGRLTELTCEIKTYLFAIGKNQILNFRKKRDREVTLEPVHLMNGIENTMEMNDKREYNKKLVEENLNRLPEHERKILELYYMQQKDMKQIAAEMGYKNADVAKKKKYQVFKKLAALIKSNMKTFLLV
ncbi:MAG: RNA polymerase sigma factor [Bacteroidota bacterium]